jgi:hypothetical protein
VGVFDPRVYLTGELTKRFKRVENATAVIWKTLLVAEQTFRRLDAPELLAEVAEGVTYVNGVRVKRGWPRLTRRPPPELIYTLLDKASARPFARAQQLTQVA